MLKQAGVVLLLGVGLVFLFQIFSPKQEQKNEVAFSSTPSKMETKKVLEDELGGDYRKELEDEAKKGFIAGCVEDGTASYQSCECAYNYIITTYGFDKFVMLGLSASKGEVSDEFVSVIIEAVVHCQ